MNLTDDTRPLYGKLRTEIVIPNHAVPSLNDIAKMNWRARVRLRERYEKIVWVATRNQHKGPVRLEIYRHSSGTLDTDNFYGGGAKQLVDAMKRRKVIVDDTPAVIVERQYEQVKIARTGPKMTVVIVVDL